MAASSSTPAPEAGRDRDLPADAELAGGRKRQRVPDPAAAPEGAAESSDERICAKAYVVSLLVVDRPDLKPLQRIVCHDVDDLKTAMCTVIFDLFGKPNAEGMETCLEEAKYCGCKDAEEHKMRSNRALAAGAHFCNETPDMSHLRDMKVGEMKSKPFWFTCAHWNLSIVVEAVASILPKNPEGQRVYRVRRSRGGT